MRMVIPRGKLFRVEGPSEWKAIPSGDYRRLTARYPDVKANYFDVKFRDSRGRQGQKDTPVKQRPKLWGHFM